MNANALGRNPSAPSPVVAAEVAALKKLGRELRACVPNDSLAVRRVLVANASPAHRKALLAVFGEFKLAV